MISLDIGCGSRPKGTVNLDRNIQNNPHHRHDYEVKNYKCFVQGDACHLPFKNNVFDLVYSSHLLEHIETPLNALEEMSRTSKNQVMILVPNNPVFKEFNKHLYSWSVTSFYNFLSLVLNNVKVEQISRFSKQTKARFIKPLITVAVLKKPFSRLIGRIIGLELLGKGEIRT